MPEPALRAVGIGKRFGGLVAVDSVDLELVTGAIHAVIGPNGAGKTTLLTMLAGDFRPTAGQVFLGDRDVTHASVEARTRLGIGRTYQRSAIIPRFTALDMVRLAALHRVSALGLLGRMGRQHQCTLEARNALARVGLGERAEVTTDVLSHGEKRRLEIAAVLALSPHILLLDEPLAGLGTDESREVVDLIAALKPDCAIMLIEHDIEAVFSISDRITVLDNGRVIASGAPDAVRNSPAVQQAYLGMDDE
jgi:branched-chain amino acid transport system ATP-binding protein